MKQIRQEREKKSSAAISQTFWLMVGCFSMFVVAAYAAPTWWSTVQNGNPANDYSVANQGQLKFFTEKAVDYMNTTLASSGGAGPALTNLVYNWKQDYLTNGYGASNIKPSDYQAVNVGQLKYIARLVYGQLSTIGYTGLYPSWLASSNATDLSVANLGQLKEIFNFDLSLPTAENLTATSTEVGTINLSWSVPPGNTSSWVVEEQNDDGAWTILETLTDPAASSYTISGLISQKNYAFQVFASNGGAVSSPVSISATPSGSSSSGPYVVLNILTDITQYPSISAPSQALISGEVFQGPSYPTFKITDSGIILAGSYRLSPTPLSPGAAYYAPQELGSHSGTPPQDPDPLNYFPYIAPSDIAEDGTVVGSDYITNSTFPNHNDQAVWPPDSTTPTITPLSGGPPVTTDADLLTDDNHDKWYTEDVVLYSTGGSIPQGWDGMFNGTEMGSLDSGPAPTFEGLYGLQMIPIKSNRYGHIITLQNIFDGFDMNGTIYTGPDYYLDSTYIPYIATVLDNSGAVAGYTNSSIMASLPTNNELGAAITIGAGGPPIAIGTLPITPSHSVYQVLGPDQNNVSALWTQTGLTNFTGPVELNTLVSTNTGYSNIIAYNMNDGGAILGIANHIPISGSQTTNLIVLVPNSITRDGLPINSTNNTVCVGQQINLTNMISGVPTNAITSYQWNIPGAMNGTAFKDYIPDPGLTNDNGYDSKDSNYTNLAPSDLTNSYCNFYWSDGATNRMITCTTTICGQTNIATVYLNVERPIASISANATNLVSLDTNYSQSVNDPVIVMHLGDITDTANLGIKFSASITPHLIFQRLTMNGFKSFIHH